jgi:hypothetical protein
MDMTSVESRPWAATARHNISPALDRRDIFSEFCFRVRIGSIYKYPHKNKSQGVLSGERVFFFCLWLKFAATYA